MTTARSLFAALALALSSQACAFETSTSFDVAEDFTDEEFAVVQEAASMWCESAGVCIEPHHVRLGLAGAVGATLIRHTKPGDAKCKDDGQVSTVAYTYRAPNMAPQIFVCPKADEKPFLFSLAILHEMGHALAGRSDHTPTGVMRAVFDEVTFATTEVDVAYMLHTDE